MNRKKFMATLPAALFAMRELCAQTPEKKGQKILIVYYSWSGNTRFLANTIKRLSNADILEILPEKPYPDSYRQTVDIAKKETDAGYTPPIKTKIPNISDYDMILIGSPNWWGTVSSPIRTFICENNLSGKKIALFITHEGSRMGRSLSDIKKLCPNSEILEALPIRGGSVKEAEKEAEKWLKRINAIS